MEILNEFNSWLKSCIAWIGKTEIFGITLDIPAHFLGGFAIVYLLAVKGVQARNCVLVLAALALFKEWYDLSALLHHGDYLEPIKDLAFTAVGGIAGYYLSRPISSTQIDQKQP